MGSKLDKFKNWVNESTEKLNQSARKLEDRVRKEVGHIQKQGTISEVYEQASYLYEIVGTSDWANNPKKVRGFLVEDDVKILIKVDEDNQELVVKNALLKDVNDESLIQIDEVFRDEMVYLDLQVEDDVVNIACFYATYKAKDIPSNVHNVVKVEEDKVVGTVHFSVKNNK